MAERYSRIYTLPGNLYSDNSPVLIVAGALLKDNQTGKMLAQLKIQNLDERTVTGISLSFVLFDADSKQIGEPFAYQFNRISVEENSYFGQKEPIILPAGNICTYQITIQSVNLSDGKFWVSEKEWTPLPIDVTFEDIKQNLHVLRQKEDEEALRELEEIERREEEKARNEASERIQRKKTTKKFAAIVCGIIAILTVILTLSVNKHNKEAAAFAEKAQQILDALDKNDSWSVENKFLNFQSDYFVFYPDTSPAKIADWEKEKIYFDIKDITEIDNEKAILSASYPNLYIYYTEENGCYTITKIQYYDEFYYER